MKEPVVALGKSLAKVDRFQRLVEKNRFNNWKAQKELDTTYVWTGKLAQALCHLAGKPEYAKYTHKPLRKIDRKLRPKKRQAKEKDATVLAEGSLIGAPYADSVVVETVVAESLPAVQESDLQIVPD
jgi:hypothetical protein